ncbi:uncharacterized protein A4U43_C02F19560 [Asparagus officinalis]|uniref:RCD1 WWE domain-containing protein n=1 Tax=Asparagus officinalis TaxID=4686 RepID=A0A5P1FK77_ASPOF|nr:uncharacterized protein A4U43_C02F19560 [Asparagus officinalis]
MNDHQLTTISDISQLYRENHANFERSGVPSRILFFEKSSSNSGAWEDFPTENIDHFKRYFSLEVPTFHLNFKKKSCLVDLNRMIVIDLMARSERSIAWIDEKGRCFFPKRSVDFSCCDHEDCSLSSQMHEDKCLSKINNECCVPDLNEEPLEEK